MHADSNKRVLAAQVRVINGTPTAFALTSILEAGVSYFVGLWLS